MNSDKEIRDPSPNCNVEASRQKGSSAVLENKLQKFQVTRKDISINGMQYYAVRSGNNSNKGNTKYVLNKPCLTISITNRKEIQGLKQNLYPGCLPKRQKKGATALQHQCRHI